MKATYTQNREISWLKFNERVLDEAMDESVPLWERLKFLAIFSSNLDEFYMIRVGTLTDTLLLKESIIDNKSGWTTAHQLKEIYKLTDILCQKQDLVYHSLKSQLDDYGLVIKHMKKLEIEHKLEMQTLFQQEILPLLAPQIIDLSHPLPSFANKQIHIITKLKKDNKFHYGLVSVPLNYQQLIPIKHSYDFVLLEYIIYEFCYQLFVDYDIVDKAMIRITRNADIHYEDEAFDIDDNYRNIMKKMLKKRSLLAPVRMEILHKNDCEITKYIQKKLNLEDYQVFRMKSPLRMDFVFEMKSYFNHRQTTELCYQEYQAVNPLGYNYSNNPIAYIQNQDILMHLPYYSMDPLLVLLAKCVNDNRVVSIRITIYRLASAAKIIEYLCNASENGKEVIVIMELRARFDEQNNMDYSRVLEDAGCKIFYGLDKYKIHSKICLITYRDSGSSLKYITHIATGNYNEKTAKMYTDFGIITSDQNIAQDAVSFFHNMLISNTNGQYSNLLVAPNCMQNKLMALIDEWIELAKHEEVSIVIKANAITELEVINKIKEACNNNVKVTLIIRGICCILPNVKGATENLEVYSLVGKYLEHHRVYWFESASKRELYISSADLMTRNLLHRVEIACPIKDKHIQQEIINVLNIILKDNQKLRILQSDGNYIKVQNNKPPFEAQLELEQLAQDSVKKPSIFDKLLNKLMQ